MNQFRMMVSASVCVALIALVGFMQTGCEEAKGIGGLQVDPASVTLTTNDTSVVLSVVGGITNNLLSMPLEWQVSDPNLGQITASSGVTAVYRRFSANGVNTVTVRDQFDKEGFATITQRASSYSFSLVAEPTSIQPNQGATIRIEGNDAQAPFNWQLVSGPGSLSGGSGSRSASYAAGATPGVAQISVTDANGISASVSITVQAADDGAGNGGPGGGGPGSG